MSLPQQTTLAIATNNPDRKFSLFDPRLGFTPTTSNPIPDQEPMQRRPPISTLPLPHPSETMQLYAGDHQRLLGPVPPSSDAELLHQRLSELRTALDASNRMCNNLESQVEGLKLSLQSKHDESTRLQLDLSRALSSLELIQASWAVSIFSSGHFSTTL